MASIHLRTLCEFSPDRRPGSPGNDQATGYVAETLRGLGWDVSEQSFDVLDWSGSAGTVAARGGRWTVHPSPYAKGAEKTRELVVARTRADLDADLAGKVVLLLDELTTEQLTPIDYPFYGNDEHAAILGRLIEARPVMVLAGTGKAPATAGALDPFPLIEDGAFPIPTGNMSPADAAALAEHAGEQVRVDVTARRWPSKARNIVARLGPASPRIVVTAHVDAKPGTPGAVDNASGVVVLLLLARILAGRSSDTVGVELVAVNGEDHYAAAGELAYLEAAGDLRGEVRLAVNVDGAGYRAGGTAYSLYEVPDDLAGVVRGALAGGDRLAEGPAWYQSDHMVFAMRGVPAVAFTTDHFETVMAEVAHSAHDMPAQVDITLLVSLSEALAGLIEAVRAYA